MRGLSEVVVSRRVAGRSQTFSFTSPQPTPDEKAKRSLGGVQTQAHDRVEIYHSDHPIHYTTIACATTVPTADMARSKSKGSGRSSAAPKYKGSSQSDAPDMFKISDPSNAPDQSNPPGRFASDPTAGAATRLLQRARRTITYPEDEIVRVGAKTSGKLPEKAFTTLPQFRTAVFRLLVERLQVHGILTDNLKEADLHWCMPTSYDNNEKSS